MDGESARPEVAASGRLQVSVTCRRDPATGERTLAFDPPEAAGGIAAPVLVWLQPGDTVGFELVTSEA